MKKILNIICWLFITTFASQSLLANEISGLEITENDFTIGDENAPITIIEYASMSCSHCADFHENGLQDIKNSKLGTDINYYIIDFSLGLFCFLCFKNC